MTNTRRRQLVAVVLSAALLPAVSATAQTIRPLVSEFQSQARGRLEVVNETDRPLNVIMEPRGFSLTPSGELQDEPLGTGISLKFSDMSFRLPPRQSRFVFYEATSDRLPAWFVVYANFTGYPARDYSGVNVQLELPHYVYLLGKESWKASDVRVNLIGFQPETHKLELMIENLGSQFGRIVSLEVEGNRRSASIPGFPLFPGTRRRVELDLTAADEPRTVTVKSRQFSFSQKLTTDR